MKVESVKGQGGIGKNIRETQKAMTNFLSSEFTKLSLCRPRDYNCLSSSDSQQMQDINFEKASSFAQRKKGEKIIKIFPCT